MPGRNKRPCGEEAVEALAAAQPAGGEDGLRLGIGAAVGEVGDAVRNGQDARALAQQRTVLGGVALGQAHDRIESRVGAGDGAPQRAAIAVQVHVVLGDTDDVAPPEPREREVEPGTRADHHAVPHGAQPAHELDVREHAPLARARVERVPGDARGDRCHAPRQCGGALRGSDGRGGAAGGVLVHQIAHRHAATRREGGPAPAPQHGDDLHVMAARREGGRGAGNGPRRPAGHVGVGDEQADAHAARQASGSARKHVRPAYLRVGPREDRCAGTAGNRRRVCASRVTAQADAEVMRRPLLALLATLASLLPLLAAAPGAEAATRARPASPARPARRATSRREGHLHRRRRHDPRRPRRRRDGADRRSASPASTRWS